jgi:hypothetical protein
MSRPKPTLFLALLLAAVAGGRALAQPSGVPPPMGGADEAAQVLVERVVTFNHREAADAVELVRPLLGRRGSVEVTAEGNLRLRDSVSSLGRILPLLSHWDHPPSLLRVDLQIVRAAPRTEPPRKTAGTLDAALVRKMGELLRFETYHLLAKTRFSALEGEAVAYQVGDFGVHFRLGTVFDERRIRLHGFRVVRDPGSPIEKQMMHSNLNPYLDQTMILGLASDEGAGRALMVVLTCSREQEP